MRENKKFFENNRLNKGYSKIGNHNKSDIGHIRKQFGHVMPPIEIMEHYEEIYPGTTQKLLDMAQNEQNHRHTINLINQQRYNKANISGRVFSVILISLICITTLTLSFWGKNIVASIFAISAFACISFVSKLYLRLENDIEGVRESRKKFYNGKNNKNS